MDNHIWVFLSHSNEDYEKVRMVRNWLEEMQFRPIMFYLKCLNDDDEVNELIKREIDCRNRFVLCQSINSRKSKWVQSEVEYIRSKNRMFQIIDMEQDLENIRSQVEQFKKRSSVFIVYDNEKRCLYNSIKIELKKRDFVILNRETAWNLENVSSIETSLFDVCNKGYILYLMTKNSTTNGLIHDLLTCAYEEKVRIFPVLLEDTWVPMRVRCFQYFDLRNVSIDKVPQIIADELIRYDLSLY